jgi:hypothetical protein
MNVRTRCLVPSLLGVLICVATLGLPDLADARITRSDPNHGKYVSAVAKAANSLQKARLMLPEDVERYMEAAAEGPIGKPATAESDE